MPHNAAPERPGHHEPIHPVPQPRQTSSPGAEDAAWRVVLDTLCLAGERAGRNAADWWAQDAVGARASGDAAATSRAVLAGIDDGDPLVLDGLPACDLSGRSADTPTEADVYTDAAPDEAPGWDDLDQPHRDQAIDAYRDAFDTACRDQVTEHCRTALPVDTVLPADTAVPDLDTGQPPRERRRVE
jgi:hypothetical protein